MKIAGCDNAKKLNSIAVITTTEQEYETVKRVFGLEDNEDHHDHHDAALSSESHTARVLSSENHTVRVLSSESHTARALGSESHIVIALCNEGDGRASSLIEGFLQQYPGIRSVIFCGTAEGIACEIGDVVISKGVLKYDHASEKEKLVKIHCSDELASAVIQTFQDEYSGNYAWRAGLSGFPKLHYADIATSDLIANTHDAATKWHGNYNIKAIEPAESGIIEATEEGEVPFLVIRGISGIAGRDKTGKGNAVKDNTSSQINNGHGWDLSEKEKDHAMMNAATYVRRVVACARGM